MVDARKILQRVKSAEAKERFTVSIDKEVFETFRKICADRAISPVVEELVREFNDSAFAAPGALDENGLSPIQREILAATAAMDEDELRAALTHIQRLTSGSLNGTEAAAKRPKKPGKSG